MAPRRSFTVKEKAEIISRLKNGENNGALCKEFKVSHSTISTMWKNRDVILECFDTKSLKMKRNRKSRHQDVENALLKWFRDQRSQEAIISSPILQEKANYFAKTFRKDFECSESWIYRFRQRYGISVGKVCGAARLSRDECANSLESDKWQACRRGRKRTQLEEEPASEFDTNSIYGHGQLGDHASQNTWYQDALVPSIKIESYCCFCGEVQNDFLNVIDKPYVELGSKKINLTLNDLSIELDFNEDSIQRNVCQTCDTRLKEITDFIKAVKNAQDKLRHVTDVDDLKSLDILNESESPSSNDGENNDFNHDSNNKANQNHNNRKINSISVKEAHKRKNNEQENSDVPKRRRVSFDLNCSLTSSYDENDESDMENNEIKYKVDNNNEIDPLEVTDRHVKEVLADRPVKEFTKDAHEDNGTIEIKEEINEIPDALYEAHQKKDTGTKMQPFEVQDTAALASEVMCRKADKMDKLDSEVHIISQIGNNSDIVTESTSESETVGAMPRSEFILLVKSIVKQLLDK